MKTEETPVTQPPADEEKVIAASPGKAAEPTETVVEAPKYPTELRDGWATIVVPLKHPIKVGDGPEKLTELVLVEPNGEALEAIELLGMSEESDPTVTQILGVIRALASVGKVVTNRMHPEDITEVGGALVPLLVGAMGQLKT